VAERYRTLSAHGIDGSNAAPCVGGFTHVGGSGFAIKNGSICSVTAQRDHIRLIVELGTGAANFSIDIRYNEVTALELTGGEHTQGTRYWSGGFGPAGILEGVLAASLLGSLSAKSSINSLMRIGSKSGEVFLHHGQLTPPTIRRSLSPMFNRHEAAEHGRAEPVQDEVGQLERLAELHRQGVLTADEFSAAKQRLLNS
jgi:hypothetical protein